ncbi:alpha/beta fold hydrolase [Streptomyces broussonetiae]|uniref:Alpha/beta fold hydrolase n=1 Tax=Streptomyces broussonetiae TaxID=2686304 RepID=A0A6I6MPX4_9ACTN|nr:alpha/beta fold hydrolase [Streptomyces broussonetiae]QHA02508.1 alpha/beta fold hydrolase [Streptomyces broussonetiae]
MDQDITPFPSAARGALVPRLLPAHPRAAVLLLHGGCETSLRPSRPWHLAALRMAPFHRAIAAARPHGGVLLAQVRYRVRGWNGTRADPVADTYEALRRLSALAGPVPTVLVGHSMGARAALRAAGHPQVYAVLGLAPWWPTGEPVQQMTGRHIVALHGERDRVTSPGDSADYVSRAQGTAARAAMAVIRHGDHAMLRRHGFWHRIAADVVAHLLDPESRQDPLPAQCYAAGGFPLL